MDALSIALAAMQNIRDQFIGLGNFLQNPGGFSPGITISGGQALQAQGAGSSLAHVYSSVTTVPLANPLTQVALVDVKARRIELSEILSCFSPRWSNPIAAMSRKKTVTHGCP